MSDDKPKKIAIIVGGRLTASLAQFLVQAARAERAMAIHHEKLIAAGCEWGGMDGYRSPPGVTEEDHARMWAESLEEAKNDDQG